MRTFLQRRSIIRVTMWSLDSLKKMDSYDFELLVGDLFESMGYVTHVTPRSRDYGVDILIKLEHFGLSHSWIIQAKKYNGSVGVREIREYGSLRMRDRVDGVIIVTTGHFSPDAQDEAGKYNVKLVSGDLLVGMLNRYLEKPVALYEGGIAVAAGKEPYEIPQDAAELLLRDNEEILLRETVNLNGNGYELLLSNRNLFLKEVGFLSRKTTLKHKIPVTNIIGAMQGKNGILLFTGGKNIRTCLIKGDGKIIDVLEQVKMTVPGQAEKLIKFSRAGNTESVLTSKRIFVRENDDIWQCPLFRISSVGLKKGLVFRNSRIVLYVTGESVEKKELAVDDAVSWKSGIESAVRSS